jgi:hypothetical protein
MQDEGKIRSQSDVRCQVEVELKSASKPTLGVRDPLINDVRQNIRPFYEQQAGFVPCLDASMIKHSGVPRERVVQIRSEFSYFRIEIVVLKILPKSPPSQAHSHVNVRKPCLLQSH